MEFWIRTATLQIGGPSEAHGVGNNANPFSEMWRAGLESG